MISVKTIKIMSEQWGVPPATIDKDWVLGCFLAGLFNNSYFREHLIFKGGTCLKKCYFGDYRFSEDLDFTAIHIDKLKIRSKLNTVIRHISSETEILLGSVKLLEKPYQDITAAFECIIPFWGANHPRNKIPPPENRWMTSIKIDFTIHETVCLEKELRSLIHPYPDMQRNHLIPCYSMEEIVSEKLRAFIQRSYAAPRDYYDLWYILRHASDTMRWDQVSEAFHTKCRYKSLNFHSIEDFFQEHKLFNCEKEWNNSLHHHLRIIPPFNEVVREIRDMIDDQIIFRET